MTTIPRSLDSLLDGWKAQAQLARALVDELTVEFPHHRWRIRVEAAQRLDVSLPRLSELLKYPDYPPWRKAPGSSRAPRRDRKNTPERMREQLRYCAREWGYVPTSTELMCREPSERYACRWVDASGEEHDWIRPDRLPRGEFPRLRAEVALEFFEQGGSVLDLLGRWFPTRRPQTGVSTRWPGWRRTGRREPVGSTAPRREPVVVGVQLRLPGVGGERVRTPHLVRRGSKAGRELRAGRSARDVRRSARRR